jgi:HEPN domain-containing protein
MLTMGAVQKNQTTSQTLEKLLKALLVLHCQEPTRSHSLQLLLQEPGPL